jgi:hypothetical protein
MQVHQDKVFNERDISLSQRSELLILSELIAEVDGKY